MKLQQLEVLLSVVDTGGIRAAARRLEVSQAAVTKSMRWLEDEAGMPLLVRRSRGIGLTPTGEKLVARARVISRQVGLAREEMRQAAGEDHGTIRIGMTPLLALTGLGEAVQWFRQRYRLVQLQLFDGPIASALPRLHDGTLDLAVVTADEGETTDDELHRRPLFNATQHVVVRAGHPVLAHPTAHALCDQEWVLAPPAGQGLQPRFEAMFALAGVQRPERVILFETLAAMAILRHSDAVGIFPQPLLGHPESQGIVPVQHCPLKPCNMELQLLSKREWPLTPAAEFFAHCLESVSRRDSPT